MKILLAHCRYQRKGGEDVVYEIEKAQLMAAGNDIISFEVSNDAIITTKIYDKCTAAMSTIWSFDSAKKLRQLIRRNNPDIVHFHNTFPQLSPSVYYACQAENIPCVQTLHNYRLLCASAMLTRDGEICELCVGGHFHNGIRYACYRDSRAASSAVVAMQYFHRWCGTTFKKVDRLIALTNFAREKFISGGIPADRLVTKANSIDVDPGEGTGAGGYALFVGRLSKEKGLLTLMDAWRILPNTLLKIAGDGPLLDEVTTQASSLGRHIQVLGHQSKEAVLRLIANARVLVVPSQWYEGFPMTIVESYACGTPIIASRIGSLSEVVQEGVTGRLFEPGNARALATVVSELFHDTETLSRMRKDARARFLARYTPERNLQALLQIYRDVLERRREIT